MRIAFYSNQLGHRGTEVNLRYLAKFNREVLNNESIIVSSTQGTHSGLDLFNDYEVLITEKSNLNSLCEQNSIDFFYAIKPGFRDDVIVDSCKQINHFVYADDWEFHGHRCAFISDYLVEKASSISGISLLKEEWSVPFYCVKLDSSENDLRDYLDIPKDAKVFGYMGGHDQFSIDWVRYKLMEIASIYKDYYFIFLGVDKFNFPSLSIEKYFRFLPLSIDETFKCEFINTCDAMIHARSDGETFGLSIAEFSLKNKPVICYNTYGDNLHEVEFLNRDFDKAHLTMLKDKGIYYRTPGELELIILNFNDVIKNRGHVDYASCYSKFNDPNYIMDRFKRVFLD